MSAVHHLGMACPVMPGAGRIACDCGWTSRVFEHEDDAWAAHREHIAAAVPPTTTLPGPADHQAEHERHLARGKVFRYGCHICVPDGAPLEDLIQDIIDAANDVVRDVISVDPGEPFTGVTVTRGLPTGDHRRFRLVTANINVTAPISTTDDRTGGKIAEELVRELQTNVAAYVRWKVAEVGRRHGVELSVEVTS